MRLTRFSDISLRALMYLGAHPERAVPAAEMSERLRVSRDHLMKSLQALAALGVVSGSRGRGGGFRLGGRAAGVRIGELVRRLEPGFELAECFGPASRCPLTGGCRLAGALREAQQAFLDTLDRYTLDDLVAAERPVLVGLGESPRESHGVPHH
ncbi:MAG TPA: Rrf2 family transcriptional regulator [Longimicrobiales bacterium]|nr:Rrf2 family transcriptional regulator [Longimicrobiales bacterium]